MELLAPSDGASSLRNRNEAEVMKREGGLRTLCCLGAAPVQRRGREGQDLLLLFMRPLLSVIPAEGWAQVLFHPNQSYGCMLRGKQAGCEGYLLLGTSVPAFSQTLQLLPSDGDTGSGPQDSTCHGMKLITALCPLCHLSS